MELVHLDTNATKTSNLESVKRSKINNNGDGRVLMETSFGKPITNKLKEFGVNGASAVFMPKIYEQVFDGKLIRVGVLEQDTLMAIRREFEAAKKSDVPVHLRLPPNLLPLNVKTVNMIGEKSRIKIIAPKTVSPIYEKVKRDVLEGAENMIGDGIVPKIPLTPANMFEVIGDKVEKIEPRSCLATIKTNSGTFEYNVTGCKFLFEAAIAKVRMDGREKDYAISDFCVGTLNLSRLLPLRYRVECIDGIVTIGEKREIDLDVDGRLLVIGATIDKILDVIKEKFSGTRVVHCCSKSIQGIVYRWLEENSIVTLEMKKELACYAVFSSNERVPRYNVPTYASEENRIHLFKSKIESFRQIIDENFHGYPGNPFSVHTSDMLSIREDDMEERIISLYNTVYREVASYKLKYEVLRVYGDDASEFLACFGAFQKLSGELATNNCLAPISIRELGPPEVKARKSTGAVLVVLADRWGEFFPKVSKDYLPFDWQKMEKLCETLQARYKRFQIYFELPDVEYLTSEFIKDMRKCKNVISIAPFCSQAMRYWINISDTRRTYSSHEYDTHFQKPLAEGYGSLVKYFSCWYFGEKMIYGEDLYRIPNKLWYFGPFRIRDTLEVCRSVTRDITSKYPHDNTYGIRCATIKAELGKSYFFKVL